MNFLERLKDYWINDAGMKSAKATMPPPKFVEPPEKLVKRCFDLMIQHKHGLNLAAKTANLWKNIPSVKCPIEFGGWGFVQGRTEGAVINKSLTFFESDDDMSFTKYTVLINNVPAMTIYSGVRGTCANIIDGKDYFSQILCGEGDLYFDTWEQFIRLPAPVKSVITDIAVALFKNRVPDDVGPEALLDYHFNRHQTHPHE